MIIGIDNRKNAVLKMFCLSVKNFVIFSVFVSTNIFSTQTISLKQKHFLNNFNKKIKTLVPKVLRPKSILWQFVVLIL